MRARSQTETKSIFWIAALDQAIDRETVEIFRSKEVLDQKGRSPKTEDETALVAEEKIRSRRHQDELKRLLKQACLTGAIFFRGNDRSPDETANDVGRVASRVLAQALPEVFDRFHEAATRVQRKDLEALMTTENLRGLTPVFSSLHLVRDQGGKPVFNTDTGPLAEVMARIENRASYGEIATGRYLTDEFSKEPFGWDFDVVRLFVVALLRAGKIEVTSKGQVIESALSLEAQNTFLNNNLFRQASFRPKVGIEFVTLVAAVEAFKDVFGHEIPEIEQSVIAHAIREAISRQEQTLQEVHTALVKRDLPGALVLQSALDQVRAIRNSSEEHAVLTFNSVHKELKEAIKRAAELQSALTDPHLYDLDRARKVRQSHWPFLQQEEDLAEAYHDHARQLADVMARETFYRELPAIDQHTKALEEEYQRRYAETVKARTEAYNAALSELKSTPGWEQLDDDRRHTVAEALEAYVSARNGDSVGIPQLRADLDACTGRLNRAVEEMMRITDGQRIVRVNATAFFKGGIETEEQLDAALTGLRDECERLIGAGKKVLVQ